ncbi:MAG TPA: hypothetical protein VJJ24_02690 [Candidatus Paceibacterota bacterium]
MKKQKNREGGGTVRAPKLAAIKPQHANKWIALSRDYKRVVASADSLVDLARTTKDQDVLVMKALPMLVNYAPRVRL